MVDGRRSERTRWLMDDGQCLTLSRCQASCQNYSPPKGSPWNFNKRVHMLLTQSRAPQRSLPPRLSRRDTHGGRLCARHPRRILALSRAPPISFPARRSRRRCLCARQPSPRPRFIARSATFISRAPIAPDLSHYPSPVCPARYQKHGQNFTV